MKSERGTKINQLGSDDNWCQIFLLVKNVEKLATNKFLQLKFLINVTLDFVIQNYHEDY